MAADAVTVVFTWEEASVLFAAALRINLGVLEGRISEFDATHLSDAIEKLSVPLNLTATS